MRTKFWRTVAATSTANLILVFGTAIGGVLMARWMGPEDRGLYAGVFAWYLVLQVVGEAGIFGATVHAVGAYPRRAEVVRRYVTNLALRQSLLVATVAGLIALVVIDSRAISLLYAAAFVTLPISLVAMAQQFTLYGLDLRLWNAARLTQIPVYIGLIVAFELSGLLTPLTAVVAGVAGTALVGLVSYGLSRRLVEAPLMSERSFVDPAFRRYATANFAWAAPALVNARLDQLVLSLSTEAEALGQYAVGASFVLLGVPLVVGIGNALFPRLSALSASGIDSKVLRIQTIGSAMVLALIVILPVALSAGKLVPLVFGQEYSEAAAFSLLLAPYAWGLAVRQVAADILRGTGNPRAAAVGETALLSAQLVVVPTVAIVVGASGVAVAVGAMSLIAAIFLSIMCVMPVKLEARDHGA